MAKPSKKTVKKTVKRTSAKVKAKIVGKKKVAATKKVAKKPAASVKKVVKKIATKPTTKPVKKSTKKVVTLPSGKRVSKIVPKRIQPKNDVSVVSKKPKNVDAPKSKLVKVPPQLDETQVLDKLKALFPELSRKRVIENVQLTPKQIKKLTTKAPKLLARIPVLLKKGLGIVDDSTRKHDEDLKEAKVRKVDETKAKDTAGVLQAFNDSVAARGEVQTSKVIKAFQLRINKRLAGLYGNYRKIAVQLNNFTAVALTEVAKGFKFSDPALSSEVTKAVSTVSGAFVVKDSTDYDWFGSAGSKFDAEQNQALDPEGDFVDEDKGEVGAVFAPHIPAPATAKVTTAAKSDDVPDYTPDDSQFNGDDDSTGDEDTKGKSGKRVKVNAIRILGKTRIRYSDKAYMTNRIPETRNMFNGMKRSAVVGFTFGVIDGKGNFSTSSTDYDENGNANRGSVPNSVEHGLSPLPFHNNRGLFDRFVTELGSCIGMRTAPGIGLQHILSRTAINFLKLNGFNSNFRILIRNNADNTGRYGVLIAVRAATEGAGSAVLTVPFGFIGLAHNEITTLCQGDFVDMPDQLFEYVSHSIIVNGLLSQGKVFGFSKKERALINPARKAGTPAADRLIKLANGHIHFLPDIDRRNEFVDYRESLKLPDQLDDVLTDADGKTEFDRFCGEIAYVDMKENIAFWYNKQGKLVVTMFDGVCDLNARDCADLMKTTPTNLGYTEDNGQSYDATNQQHRERMSPYGAETNLPIRYLGTANINKLDTGSKKLDGFPGFSGQYILVNAENLRTSYNGDQVYFKVIQESVDNYLSATDSKLDRDHNGTPSGNALALMDVNGGLTDLDYDTASAGLGSKKDRLSPRDASAIKIMLHIAKQSRDVWPTADVWQQRSEDARVKPPAVEDLQDVVGAYNGLKPNPQGEHPTLMPHQAYVLHTLKHQETAALDCDMGGGKTLMSVMDATSWIKDGVHGKAARPCIIMPGSLIENYMTDVKTNFLGNNINFFVLSTETTSKWSKMDNSKINNIAQRAPANTIFVASYEWLGLSKYPVVTGTQKAPKSLEVDGEKVKIKVDIPKFSNIYPNVQLLLDIGINVLYLDESQKIKNKSSETHDAVQGLSGIPIKRIMTGTMVSRDVDDVFTQTSFIDGTMIGTRTRFVAQYCEKGSQTEIRKGLEKKVRVHLLASGVMQIRRSMWLGLLPKKEEHFEFVNLSELHGSVYEVLIADLDADEADLLKTAYYINNPALIREAKAYRDALLYGRDSDQTEDATTQDLDRLRDLATGDVSTEDEDEEGLLKAGRSKTNKLSQYLEKKTSMAVKASMLQAFISSPQALKPEMFSRKAQEELKNLNAELPTHTAKDTKILELIEKHWAPIGGSYIKASEQQKNTNGNATKMRGKIIIFALNVSTIEHVYEFLKKSKYGASVVSYIKSRQGKGGDNPAQNLVDFKDPENDQASIIVATETTVIYGQNMQAADMMIKLTMPWTTGDYDQAVARIFRNGQKLSCEVWNIIANGTFEIAKTAKFLIRQNSNRKLISDYKNKYNLASALGALSKESASGKLKSGDDIANFSYEDKDTGAYVRFDLLAAHQSVWQHEIAEAQTHLDVFRAAGYGDLNTSRIEMSSGDSVIGPDNANLLPIDPDGKKCEPGQLKLADMAYFNGDNYASTRDGTRAEKSKEIKLQRKLEIAGELGEDTVTAIQQRTAKVQLNQNMAKAVGEVLSEHSEFKKFIPAGAKEDAEDSTRGFSLWIGKALREANYRIIFARDLSYGNFAEKAGNDLSDLQVRAELMTFARLVYNKVLIYYPGCVALDDDIDVKLGRNGKPVEITGYDEKKDLAVLRKNAKIISAVVGHEPNKIEKTHTEKMIEENKQVSRRERAVKDVEDVDDDEDVVDEEGLNFGVSDMIFYDVDEDGPKNLITNDLVYLFAPITGNKPKFIRQLLATNLGVGRGTRKFAKKVIWLYPRPVTSMSSVATVAASLEKVGGFVEKIGKGPSAKYAITTDPASLALFRVKAPTNFGKPLADVGGIHGEFAHASTESVAAAVKKEVDLGLYMFDRRVLVEADCSDVTVLERAGFKKLTLIRLDFQRSANLKMQLETAFKKIKKAGISVLNADIIARRLKVLVGKKVEV